MPPRAYASLCLCHHREKTRTLHSCLIQCDHCSLVLVNFLPVHLCYLSLMMVYNAGKVILPQPAFLFSPKVKVLSGHRREILGVHNDTLIARRKPKQTKDAATNEQINSLRSYIRWTRTHSLPLFSVLLCCNWLQCTSDPRAVFFTHFHCWIMWVWAWCDVFFSKMKTHFSRHKCIDNNGQTEKYIGQDFGR